MQGAVRGTPGSLLLAWWAGEEDGSALMLSDLTLPHDLYPAIGLGTAVSWWSFQKTA